MVALLIAGMLRLSLDTRVRPAASASFLPAMLQRLGLRRPGALVMEKVDLEFLARQMERLLDDLADLKDDMAVLMARLERMEATSNILQAEIRATHNRRDRLSKRAAGLESRDHNGPP
jgi:hypothetical protein